MIKRLLSCVREYKKASILAPLYICIEVILDVLIPWLMADMIDKGFYANGGRGDLGYVIKNGIILLIIAAASMVFGALSGKYAAIASCGFAKNLRHDMYHNVQRFSFSNIDKFSGASIITRLTTDVTNVQMSYQMIVRMGMRSPSMLIFSLVFAFRIHARLALVLAVVLPVLIVGLYTIMTSVHGIFKNAFKKYDKLNSIVQENVHGVRVVKSFVRDDFEVEKFNAVSENIYKDMSRAEKILAFNGPLMQTCMYATTLIISWLGARIIASTGQTELLTGELTSLIAYATQVLNSLMGLSMIFVMIVISRASMERICELLAEEPDIVDGEAGITIVADGSVEFDNVSFAYGKHADKNSLDKINLKIESGMTVGVIGGTGSSKSTLVSLIPRLYDAVEGTVKVGGRDVREYTLDALRGEVAMVLQKNVLFSGTIKENLRWGCEDATDAEMEHACRLASAHGFIESFPDGYDTYIEQGGTNVSGGQKQRLCIARALLKKPKILILDDSTSAVDTKTDAQIRAAFATEIPDTTKIIIAQRISSVMECDMIIVMDDGKVASVGNHESLMAESEIYREVYTSQMKGAEL